MRKVAYCALGLLALASLADAAEIDANLFGHKVRVVNRRNDPDYWNKGLEIDGKTVVRKASISIDEISIHNGVPILIGYAAPGGNSCDSAPFVVSFPPGETPRVDGPIDTCSAPSQSAEAEPFRPKGSGWLALRTRSTNHPAELYTYADTNLLIDSMAASKSGELRTILFGPGSGAFAGDTFVGSACQPHNCVAMGSLFIAEVPTRRIYVAWKPDGAPIEVRPRVAEWPAAHRQRLKEWAKAWTRSSLR